jgi:hypothetical protein
MITTATVEVQQASIHVVKIAGRKVTTSVWRQLDRVEPDEIEPFGRVQDAKDEKASQGTQVFVIGRGDDGSLVRSSTPNSSTMKHEIFLDVKFTGAFTPEARRDARARSTAARRNEIEKARQWEALPLIVV